MSITAPPLVAMSVGLSDHEELTNRRLRLAGVAVLVAAALGSVLGASPALTDTPSTDSICRVDINGTRWSSSGCVAETAGTAAR